MTVRTRRGLSLATVLLLVATAAVLAVTVAANSIQHLRVSTRLSNVKQARNLAESVVALGLERVLKTPAFGVARKPEEALSAQIQGPAPGSLGRLTFSPDAGLPYSTNNLQGDGAVAGWNQRVVPGHALQLVGTGECGGEVRRVEAVLRVPQFPYVIASSGPLRSTGTFYVAALKTAADAAWGATDLIKHDPADLLPGHLVSNSRLADSVDLRGNATITGDLQTSGGVVKASTLKVGGEIRTNAEPARFPKLTVTDYDPVGRDKLQTLSGGLYTAPALEGWVRREGSLIVTGGLQLNRAALYVNGDLTVEGGIQGTGAVFVTGTTVIHGDTQITTDNEAALVTRGDVVMSGIGQSSSQFQGMIYTEGNFAADQISLLGTFIANGQAVDGSTSVFKNANLLQAPEFATIDFQHGARAQMLFARRDGRYKGQTNEDPDKYLKFYVTPYTNGSFLIYQWGKLDEQGVVRANADSAIAYLREQILAAKVGMDGQDQTDMSEFDQSLTLKKRNPYLDLLALSKGATQLPFAAVDLVTINPSMFIGLKDEIRLVLWREL